MTEQPDTAVATPTCEHYWAWVSPAGTGHAARLCQLCHAPDAVWLEEVADDLDAARARVADLETEVSVRYRSVVHSCCEEKATAEAEIHRALASRDAHAAYLAVAEARIAAALVAYEKGGFTVAVDMRRALTKDVE